MKKLSIPTLIAVSAVSFATLLLSVYPFIYNFISSVLSIHETDNASKTISLTLAHYRSLVSDIRFTTAVAQGFIIWLTGLTILYCFSLLADRQQLPRSIVVFSSYSTISVFMCFSGITAAAAFVYYVYAPKYGFLYSLWHIKRLQSTSDFPYFTAALILFYAGTAMFLGFFHQKKLLLPLWSAVTAGTFSWQQVFSPLLPQNEILTPGSFMFQLQAHAIAAHQKAGELSASSVLLTCSVVGIILVFFLTVSLLSKKPNTPQSKHTVSSIFIVVVLLLLILFAIFVSVWIAIASFSSTKALFSGNILNATFSIVHYRLLFSEYHLGRTLINTALYSLIPSAVAVFPALRVSQISILLPQKKRQLLQIVLLTIFCIPPICAVLPLSGIMSFFAHIDERIPLLFINTCRSILLSLYVLIPLGLKFKKTKPFYQVFAAIGISCIYLWNDYSVVPFYIREPAFQSVTQLIMSLIKSMRYTGSQLGMFAAVVTASIPPILVFFSLIFLFCSKHCRQYDC